MDRAQQAAASNKLLNAEFKSILGRGVQEMRELNPLVEWEQIQDYKRKMESLYISRGEQSLNQPSSKVMHIHRRQKLKNTLSSRPRCRVLIATQWCCVLGMVWGLQMAHKGVITCFTDRPRTQRQCNKDTQD